MEDTLSLIERMFDLINRYGVGLAIVMLLIVGAVLYGPKLIKAHLSFLETSEETSKKLADGIQATTATHDAHFTLAKDSQQVAYRCGHHFCDVLEHVGDKLQIQDRIGDSVGAIRRELDKVKPS